MGMAAAWKARRIMTNAQRVVACELLCAAQGIEFLKPLRPGRGAEAVYEKVRSVVPAYVADRPHTPDIEMIAAMLAREAII